MAESTDFVEIPNAISANLSGAGNVQTIIPLRGTKTLGLAEIADGTLAATIAVWTSGNYIDPGNGDAAGIAAAEARADWNVLASGLANPAGAGIDSRVVLNVCDAAIRIRATYTSGAGNIRIHAKKLSV